MFESQSYVKLFTIVKYLLEYDNNWTEYATIYSPNTREAVRSFTGMGRITRICAFEYFLCTRLEQGCQDLPQKLIIGRNMQFRYRKK